MSSAEWVFFAIVLVIGSSIITYAESQTRHFDPRVGLWIFVKNLLWPIYVLGGVVIMGFL